MQAIKKWGAAAVIALVAGVTVGAAPAEAAPTVPSSKITDDPNASNGTLTFFDTSGQVVTSGTDLTHLFDYAKASTAASRAGSTKATLFFGFPDHNQSDSQNWVEQQQSSSTNYPNAAAPAPLTTSPDPVVTLTSANADLAEAKNGVTLDSTDGYAGIVQVRVYDSGPGVAKQAPFWATDIYFDATAGTWQQVYPAATGPVATATSLSADPSATTTGKTTTLTAKVSPTAAGSVQFFEGTSSLGIVDETSGSATFTTGALTSGNHSYTATFTPSDTSSFKASTSSAVTVSVTAPKPDSTSLTISKSATVTYGKTAKITGTLKDSKTSKAISGAAVMVYLRHSATAAWTKSSTVHSSSTGAVGLTVKPASKTYYQWRYVGSSTHSAATSASTTISVKQVVTLHATPAKITHGKSLKLWGGVSPSVSGRKITLQKKSGASYKTVASTTVKKQKLPNGKTGVGYVFTVKLATKGTFVYRTIASSTSTLVGGTSAAATVKAV